MYTNTDYNIHGAIPLLFISPCWFPFAPLSDPLYLLGNPPSCDRICPPWSQVACKLTSPFSALSRPSPLQIPRTQVTKRLTMTTSRTWLLLSGTIMIFFYMLLQSEIFSSVDIFIPDLVWWTPGRITKGFHSGLPFISRSSRLFTLILFFVSIYILQYTPLLILTQKYIVLYLYFHLLMLTHLSIKVVSILV